MRVAFESARSKETRLQGRAQTNPAFAMRAQIAIDAMRPRCEAVLICAMLAEFHLDQRSPAATQHLPSGRLVQRVLDGVDLFANGVHRNKQK
jgi:hypothetical protein